MHFDLSFTTPDQVSARALRMRVKQLREYGTPMRYDTYSSIHFYAASVTCEIAGQLGSLLVGYVDRGHYGPRYVPLPGEVGACECWRLFVLDPSLPDAGNHGEKTQ